MITLIGGSGFIGTKLIDILKDEYKVINLDKSGSSRHPEITRIGDVRNNEDLKQLWKENDLPSSENNYVVLLAAEHRDDVSPVSLYNDVNVNGTRQVLAAMEERNINKIVFTSSVAVYGLNKENPSEDHPAAPFNHYGKSKWEAEEVLREWYQKDPQNRTLIIIRPTVVFGPGNRGNVYNLLKQIASGKFLMIGKGNNKKSMAYVENVAGFIKFCIEKRFTGYHLFNYADKPDLSMNELIQVAETSLKKKLPPVKVPYSVGYMVGIGFDVLAKITGKKFPISAVRVKKFCATTQFENAAVRNSGYAPPFTLQEGLGATIHSIINGSENQMK